MKKIILIFMVFGLVLNINSTDLQTVAEKSNYKKTSLYKDVMNFIWQVQKKSPMINVVKFAYSTEGRMIPLVVVSKEGISRPSELSLIKKSPILIMANIHAGEIEGKEATLMMLREFSNNKLTPFLKNQVVLILPIFNADGNEKLGKNRRDNGPELAGTRANGQNLDLNRDYMKLASPEVRSLVKLFNKWDPLVIVDMHTTNGSYHQEPVTYSTLTNPNTDENLQNYMWQKFLPAVDTILKKKYNYESIPYGNFTNRAEPGKGGWRNHAFQALYGSNYGGLRNRLTVLNENYSHADFKTRVLGSFGFITIIEYTDSHIDFIKKLVREADLRAMDRYHQDQFHIKYKVEKLFDITIKSYEFIKEKIKPEDKDKYPPWVRDFIIKKTAKLRDYKIPYLAKAIPTESISLPQGYILLPHQANVLKNLRRHGIKVEKIWAQFKTEAEVFQITKIALAKRIYQGNVAVNVEGDYKKMAVTVPKGSHLISLKQPLARLIAELLEPKADSSLIKWGFFNRKIVRQWSRQPGQYPVLRITNLNLPVATILE